VLFIRSIFRETCFSLDKPYGGPPTALIA